MSASHGFGYASVFIRKPPKEKAADFHKIVGGVFWCEGMPQWFQKIRSKMAPNTQPGITRKARKLAA